MTWSCTPVEPRLASRPLALQPKGRIRMHACEQQADPIGTQAIVELGQHIEGRHIQLARHLEVEDDR